VRGEFVNNKTVVAICEHMDKKEKLGNEIIELMKQAMVQVEIEN
jgi:hypothetical protein